MTTTKNKPKHSRTRSLEPRCPWCHSTHIWADHVDVGVGMLQSSPYGCEQCHAYEIGTTRKARESATTEELRRGWFEGEYSRTANQRHSNYMLAMRRMLKEIGVLLCLQDINYEITDAQARRLCQIAGFDEQKVERTLKSLMALIDVTD